MENSVLIANTRELIAAGQASELSSLARELCNRLERCEQRLCEKSWDLYYQQKSPFLVNRIRSSD